MTGLLVQNIYGELDCYRMDMDGCQKMGTYSRKDVLREMSKGRLFHAFSKETTQYLRLHAVFSPQTRSVHMRTDRHPIASDSFFLHMDAPRMVPYLRDCCSPWADLAALPKLLNEHRAR